MINLLLDSVSLANSKLKKSVKLSKSSTTFIILCKAIKVKNLRGAIFIWNHSARHLWTKTFSSNKPVIFFRELHTEQMRESYFEKIFTFASTYDKSWRKVLLVYIHSCVHDIFYNYVRMFKTFLNFLGEIKCFEFIQNLSVLLHEE